MKTKQDLLDRMAKLGACSEATEFVRNSKKRTAKAVWLECDNVSWLCWFAFRCIPVGGFAFECADRAVRTYAPRALRARGREEEAAKLEALGRIVDRASALHARTVAYAYAAKADADADYAAGYAGYAAGYAGYAAAERKLQLKALHTLWPQIAESV